MSRVRRCIGQRRDSLKEKSSGTRRSSVHPVQKASTGSVAVEQVQSGWPRRERDGREGYREWARSRTVDAGRTAVI